MSYVMISPKVWLVSEVNEHRSESVETNHRDDNERQGCVSDCVLMAFFIVKTEVSCREKVR